MSISAKKSRRSIASDPNLQESDDDERLSPLNSRKKTFGTRQSTKPKNGHDSSLDQGELTASFSEKRRTLDEIIESEAAKYFNYGKPNVIQKRKGKKSNDDGAKATSKLPQLMPDELRNCFEDGQDDQLIETMKTKHAEDFDRWMLYLSEGANILLSGYGSKLDLLEEFRQRQLVKNGYSHLLLHGYRPDVNIKQLLDTLIVQFELDIMEKPNTVGSRHRLIQKARQIRDAFNAIPESKAIDFVIIIHSIDGVALRDDESQTVFSYLAEIKNCRIFASVDHVNASLLWDNVKMDRFRWMNISATTYSSYRKEIVDGYGSRILGLTKSSHLSGFSHTLAGLQSIWSSINKNAQAVFVKLAKHQLGQRSRKGRGTESMTFWNLFNSCREDFIVSSEAALRQFLTEFQDHNLLKARFNDEDQEVFQLSIENELLVEFMVSQGVEMGDIRMDDMKNVTFASSRVDDPSERSSDDEFENDIEADEMDIDDSDASEYALDDLIPIRA